ncbi:hypothetical protein E4T66_17970 [Sinimarinibacterium sp. CAU 1509]|uniref:type 4b pilus protein PilO2 n=1 Tax=Sinimarinibacterium sp. CAU 1509 TaxID=2562283 RepID=UPI0010ABE9F3|nr:type 4b pilus protein PilO2 [Sinimarinibacterium sp. CAU 1509]TJY57293.1 hypothetical protein E4T66_17970 [Sinimarinibacterium sp. CAU 1509]
MASIARIGTRARYVANLEWRAAEKDATISKRVAAMLADERATYGVYYDTHSTSGVMVRVVGMVPDRDYEPKLKGLPSLAAAVAQKLKDGFVVTPLNSADDPSRWWFCGFSNGAVRPGTDLVAHQDTVIAHLREHLEEVGDAPVYVPLAVREHLLNLDRTLREFDLDDLLADAPDDFKIGRLKSQTSAAAIALLFAAAAVGGLGYFGYTFLFPEAPEVVDALTAEELAAQVRETFLSARGLQVDTVLTTQHNVWVHDAKAFVFGLPRVAKGYELDKAVCLPTGRCKVTYVAAKRPSLEAFRRDFEAQALGPVVFPMDGGSAEMTMQFSTLDATARHRAPAFYDAIPDHRAFVQELVTRLQRFSNIMPTGWGRTLAPVRTLSIGATNPFGSEYFLGTVSITLEQLWLFEHLINVLASEYLSIQKVEFLNHPSPAIKFDANYVIAKYPETQ